MAWKFIEGGAYGDSLIKLVDPNSFDKYGKPITILAPDGEHCDETYFCSYGDDELTPANRRLIEAAPRLAQALEAICAIVGEGAAHSLERQLCRIADDALELLRKPTT